MKIVGCDLHTRYQPGAPSFSRTLRRGWVMRIIGALYGGALYVAARYKGGRCRS